MTDYYEFLRQTYVARTPHMCEIGLTVTAIEPARGSMSLPADPRWLGDRDRGVLHPGPLIVLADSACGLAVGAALDRDMTYATLDLRMDYLRPASPDTPVQCDAHCYRLTRSVAFIRADVWQTDPAQPIATAQSAFMLGTPSGARPVAAQPSDALRPDAFTQAAARAMAALGTPGAAKDGRPAPEPGAWQPPAGSEPALPSGQVPYVDFLGLRLTADATQPIFRMPFDPKLVGNPYLPALHGGVVAGFAETAAILHLSQSLHGARLPKAIDFSLDYLRAGRPEETFAACEVVRLGGRVALVTVRVWQRTPDTPIAVARVHVLLAART
jgi:uncharacterized protein (TIGR00369 family)